MTIIIKDGRVEVLEDGKPSVELSTFTLRLDGTVIQPPEVKTPMTRHVYERRDEEAYKARKS